MCLANAVAIVGAAINEPTKVTCEVDGFPPPKNFQWTLNNSMGTSEIEPVSTIKFIMDVNVHCTLNRIIDVSVLKFVLTFYCEVSVSNGMVMEMGTKFNKGSIAS